LGQLKTRSVRKAEIEQVLNKQLNPDLIRWVDGYAQVGKRNLYLWKWVRQGVEVTTLSCVEKELFDFACDTKVLGVVLDGTPGPLNAITDIPGVAVGFATLISGEGKREVGKGPVRTGVTVDELKEVFLQVAIYAGVPSANAAFALAKRVLASEPGPSHAESNT
jgi:hypothetical protein